jgi:hypothetical protein
MEANNQTLTKSDSLRKKTDAAGWGLLFIWIGIAHFASMSWGAGLLGVGLIILGIQTARYLLNVKWEGVWVVAGLFLTLGGAWELFHIRINLMPVLCIAAGVALLGTALAGRFKHQTDARTPTL